METKPYWQRTEVILPALFIAAKFILEAMGIYFPNEAFLAVGGYIASRVLSKEGGTAAKAGLKTSEFWVATLTGPLLILFPDLPKEQFYAVITYIVGMGWKKRGTAVPATP